MKTRVEETIGRHDKGYNCAQAVACTYCDLVGVDEETMFKMTEALGLGMGGMEGTCGAITGACVLAGMKNSTGNLEKPNSKGASYKLSRLWRNSRIRTERLSAGNSRVWIPGKFCVPARIVFEMQLALRRVCCLQIRRNKTKECAVVTGRRFL